MRPDQTLSLRAQPWRVSQAPQSLTGELVRHGHTVVGEDRVKAAATVPI